MNYTLIVDLDMQPAALPRALRMVERRSRRIIDLDAHSLEGGRVLLRITVEGRLPPQVLASQLRNQYDVRSVRYIVLEDEDAPPHVEDAPPHVVAAATAAAAG